MLDGELFACQLLALVHLSRWRLPSVHALTFARLRSAAQENATLTELAVRKNELGSKVRPVFPLMLLCSLVLGAELECLVALVVCVSSGRAVCLSRFTTRVAIRRCIPIEACLCLRLFLLIGPVACLH